MNWQIECDNQWLCGHTRNFAFFIFNFCYEEEEGFIFSMALLGLGFVLIVSEKDDTGFQH